MTIFKSALVNANKKPASTSPKGIVLAAKATYTALASPPGDGDVVEMVPVPAGAIILDIKAAVGGTATANASVGDGGAAARFKALTDVDTKALLQMTTAVVGYQYAADDTIDITFDTAGMTEDETCEMTVLYMMA